MAKDLDLEDQVEQQVCEAEKNADDQEDRPLNAWVDFRDGEVLALRLDLFYHI